MIRFRAMVDRAASPAQTFSLALVILAGAALRLWQYFGHTSLGIDELALAESVLHRPFGALLTRPLAFDQIAPPGFLALLKGTTAVFGQSELALRLVPLICMLACLPLFAAVARRVLSGWAAVFATALFAAGAHFIRYGAEVKQYSTDIVVSLVLTLLALRLLEESSRRPFLIAGLVGMTVVWFSQAAVLVLAGLGAALALNALHRAGWRGLRQLVPTLVLWGTGAVAAIAASYYRMTPASLAYAKRYWSEGFVPLPPRSVKDLLWLPEALLDFWRSTGLPYPWEKLFLALTIIGGVALWMRRREDALVLLGPVGVALAAAAARQYPFGGRLTLFLSPAFLLCAAAGAHFVVDAFAGVRVPRVVTALLLALPPAIGFAHQPRVQFLEQTRPLLVRLAASRREGDAVYVYYGARRAFAFYAPRTGVEAAGVILGNCHRGDPRSYLRELDSLRSRARVWIFFAHTVQELDEGSLIRAYLHEIGRQREVFKTPGAALELYDLSDPALLSEASSDTFPVPVPDPKALESFVCDNGPIAEGPVAAPRTR